ncbi:MAG: universal stress protein [Ilumatobacteraceae bacterium]
MRTIVVPLDGSLFAERAVRPACAIAARLDRARVVMLRCATADDEIDRRRLDHLAATFADVAEVEVRVIGSDQPAAAILDVAADEPGALVCMATHGHGGLRAAMMGSVSQDVVRGSTHPLLLVGPACRTAVLPGERGLILVCSDGSTFSDSVVPTAAAWSRTLGLGAVLAESVGPDERPVTPEEHDHNREVESATGRLGALAERFREAGSDDAGSSDAGSSVTIEVLLGQPGQSIVECAERLPASVVAVATHGRSRLSQVTMGSVAADVVRHSPCPVLVTRPAGGAP